MNIEKKTFLLHLLSQVFWGISLGIFLLHDIILKKTLQGTDFDVLILVYLLNTSFLFSIYGTEIINHSSNPARMIIILGLAGRIFLFLIPVINSLYYFIFVIIISSYLDYMLFPSWNVVFKHNYSDSKRSKYYAYASTITTGFTLAATTLTGLWLDVNENVYKILFPLAGVFGIITYLILAKMWKLSPLNITSGITTLKSFSLRLLKDIILLPFRKTFAIFKENKSFLKFEINFFIYGMAFMIMLPVIPVFIVDELYLGYPPISFGKGLVYHSALILFTPLMGKFHGTGKPARFCSLVFFILALFPLLLLLSKYFNTASGFPGINSSELIFYLAYFIFGLGMSGITIVWNIGSIYYAPPEMVSNYQAVHITMTGVRGLFAPVIGYIAMQIFSKEIAFILSSFLFLTASVLMLRDAGNPYRSYQ